MKGIRPVALLFVLFAWAGYARGLTISGRGFTFELPSDWRQMSPQEMENASTLKIKPASTTAIFMAFQPKEHKRPFQYPYLVVRSEEHPGGRVDETITEKRIMERTTEIVGIPSEALGRHLTPDAHSPPDAELPWAGWFTTPPGFRSTTHLTLGEEEVRVRQIGFLGRDFDILMVFTGRLSEEEIDVSTVDALANSFRWKPSQTVKLETSTLTGNMPLYIMTGLFLAVCAYVGFRVIKWYIAED